MTTSDSDSLLESLLQRLDEASELGEPIRVESLIQETAEGALSEDDLLQLVYAEIDARSERGEHPQLSEYERRFPAQATRLRRLFEIHVAVVSGLPKEKAVPRKPAAEKAASEFQFDLTSPPPLPPLRPPSHQQETFIPDAETDFPMPNNPAPDGP